MKQLILTIRNFWSVGVWNTNMFRFLYKECSIPVYRIREDNTGLFWWYNDQVTPWKIEISRKMDKIEVATTLLHEVGHLKDFNKMRKKFKLMPKKKSEKSAWKWAIRFSRDYELEINGKLAIEWLGTYKAEYKCLENLAARQSL